jgi:polar amino acid transport system substrate-binding protein
MMSLSPETITALAPTGTLRAAINVGNPILARLNASGEPAGVSVDLARALADQLGVGLALTVFDTAFKSVDAVAADQADIGFFAIDPQRGTAIGFTAPYVLIEGSYLVPAGSAIQDNAAVDASGHRVAVVGGSAYDLFLKRALTQAQIVRAPNTQAVMAMFLDQQLEVAAGIRQMLLADAQTHPGQLRLLPGRFMVIEQAMGLPKDRAPEAQRYLRQFVEEMKSSGFVAASLKKHKIEGASIAPASPQENR